MVAVTVILPVHDRTVELERALKSLQGQSLDDFECMVVDDASSVDIGAVVAAFEDPRFHVIRRESNGGPAGARKTGYAVATGEFVLGLDSDWELYPWALERGVHTLNELRSVDMVTALHVRHEDSRLFVRVVGGRQLVTPADFRRQAPLPDRVAMVRRNVVERWLTLPGEFFALEAGLAITAELHHSSLALDEPWVRYHTGGHDRVTVNRRSTGRARALKDISTLLRERGDLLNCGPCVSVDRLLEESYFTLVRSRHPDASLAAATLRARGVEPRRAIARELRRRVRQRAGRGPSVAWLELPSH